MRRARLQRGALMLSGKKARDSVASRRRTRRHVGGQQAGRQQAGTTLMSSVCAGTGGAPHTKRPTEAGKPCALRPVRSAGIDAMNTMEHVMNCAARARSRAPVIHGSSRSLSDHRIERRSDGTFGTSLKLGTSLKRATSPKRLETCSIKPGARPTKRAPSRPARPPRKLLRVKGLGSRLGYPQATFVPPSIFAPQPSPPP